MRPLNARVKGGRLLLDVPTDLPDESEVGLVPVDADTLDDVERAALEAALDESEAELEAGQVVTEDELWAHLGRISEAQCRRLFSAQIDPKQLDEWRAAATFVSSRTLDNRWTMTTPELRAVVAAVPALIAEVERLGRLWRLEKPEGSA
jgi:hypothetical protein